MVEVAVPGRSSAPGHDAFPVADADEFADGRVGPSSTTAQVERLAGGRVAEDFAPGAVAVGHDLPRHRCRKRSVAVQLTAAVGDGQGRVNGHVEVDHGGGFGDPNTGIIAQQQVSSDIRAQLVERALLAITS
ncbi:hypothetical protein ACZ91_67055 [Streptomyces regensis]|nr:hypothetical protein ACZ91_67055 [Streptomyces regensis]